MANLKLFHINKIYDGGVHAVKDFSLDIDDKEFVVFVGPSGCGKSTVLRMIAGLENISSGDLFIGDRIVNSLPPKERNISMVFQNYALFPNMSVYDNISYGLRVQGEDKEVIKEKVTSVAQMLNLSDYLYRKPTQLSGGQRQRVALGRAIVRHPDVFLLDEPLSNLDAKLRNKMRNEIMSLHHKLGATFIYVTHDQVEAMTMGDKIVAMRDGTIMQIGSPTMLYRYPANMFVAGFIGTPQMNFWEGEISLAGGLSAICPLGRFPLEGELALRLDGEAVAEGKRIVIGMRPEHVYATRKKATDVAIKVNISVLENFCAYSVFHGEGNGGLTVVGQDKVSDSIQGREVTLYADVENIHIFDAETEKTLLPMYARSMTVPAVKSGNELKLLGGTVKLPEWQADTLLDGNISVRIPADAVGEGDIPTACREVLDTDKAPISLLDFDGTSLYAIGDFSQRRSVGLDLSRLELIGDARITAIPESFVLPFTYERVREKDNGKTVTKHYCRFGDEKMESFWEFNKRMYRLGRSIFKNKYQMYLTAELLRPAREDECFPCLHGIVEQVFDYGDEKYSRVSVNGVSLYVRAELPVGEEAVLAVDLDNVRVSAADSDTILF